MTQYAFGVGALIALRTDAAGASPAQFGTLQQVQLDLSFTVKELTGQFQAPAALARQPWCRCTDPLRGCGRARDRCDS